jgi:hypothetical protein
MRGRDIEYNSHKYMSNTPGGVQVLPPNDLIPIEYTLSTYEVLVAGFL